MYEARTAPKLAEAANLSANGSIERPLTRVAGDA
jgi:hypothetical protein